MEADHQCVVHGAQPLVCPHRSGSVEFGLRQAGADHVETVEPGLGSDGDVITLPCEDAVVVDGPCEVLCHLVPADDPADPLCDLLLSLETALVAPCRRTDGLQQGLGGFKEFRALAGPVIGQQGIATDHEALAGVCVTGDLHQVCFIEQRHLDVTSLDHGTDSRSPESTDPVQPRRFHLFADPRLGQHPAVSHQHHLRKREPLLHRGDL